MGRLLVVLACGLALAGPSRVWAHEDPPGCNETGAAINVGIFRDSNATIALTGAVSPCEIVYYRAVLSKVPPQVEGDTVCAFSGATFDFKLPNNTVTVISASVPCIGATVGSIAESCVAGLNSLVGPVIQYQVNPVDVVGNSITALSTYGIAGGIPGVAHDSPGNTSGVTQSSPKTTTVLSCDDLNACTTDVCDMPTQHGTAGCSHNPIDCNDGNACTADGCNPETGCFHIDISGTCDDGNPCTADGCDSASGCFHIDISGNCNDGNACTFDGCDSASGCFHVDISGNCNDQNACTVDGCNPQSGCTHAPILCGDNNVCTIDDCDPQTGCTHTDNSGSCNDQNACTTDGCNPQTGCTHTDISATCNDGDPCTDDSCVPSVGCVHSPGTGQQCADHFQCYEVKPAAFVSAPVTSVDRFGSQTLTLRYPHRLCAPANKNSEGINDPVQHLVAYETVRTTFAKRTGLVITNQFGTTTIDLTRRDFLMVPSAKSVAPAAPPAPLQPPFIDHFQCYKAKRTAGTPRFVKTNVTVADQFEAITETLLKPYRLCVPTNKNNEDPTAPSHTGLLLCYKGKSATRFGQLDTHVNNQFGTDDLLINHRRELCVPSSSAN